MTTTSGRIRRSGNEEVGTPRSGSIPEEFPETPRKRDAADDWQALQGFAHIMWEKLRANAHKKRWDELPDTLLYERLLDEVDELSDALERGCNGDMMKEAADVANFAMMLADNAHYRMGASVMSEQVGATHELKIHPQPFMAIMSGEKTYEIRKNDRAYQVGDTLHLNEWEPTSKTYTGRSVVAKVTHMTQGGNWGLPDDMCVLAVKLAPTGESES